MAVIIATEIIEEQHKFDCLDSKMAGEKRKKGRDIKRIIAPLQALYISSLIHQSIIAFFCFADSSIRYLNAVFRRSSVYVSSAQNLKHVLISFSLNVYKSISKRISKDLMPKATGSFRCMLDR